MTVCVCLGASQSNEEEKLKVLFLLYDNHFFQNIVDIPVN